MSSGLSIGQVLHGTYRISRRIARGGMGIVFEAEHVRLSKKRFAVKVLSPVVMEDPAAYARFRREAEIVSSLGHPNIVYVLDFNELEDGQPYMVMELLEGESLKSRLRKVYRLQPGDLIKLLEQAGGALQVVHDQGIVHRDLKPNNIFLLDSPVKEIHVKLLDFGISKIHHSKSVVTRDQSLMGTPFYMSPEQARGSVHDIDPRTDIFSLAIITYLCICGELPFDAPTIPGVLFNVCYENPQPVKKLNPSVPEGVDEVLARALAKNKEDRYQRVLDFVGDMKGVLAGARSEEWELPTSPHLSLRLHDLDRSTPASDSELESDPYPFRQRVVSPPEADAELEMVPDHVQDVRQTWPMLKGTARSEAAAPPSSSAVPPAPATPAFADALLRFGDEDITPPSGPPLPAAPSVPAAAAEHPWGAAAGPAIGDTTGPVPPQAIPGFSRTRVDPNSGRQLAETTGPPSSLLVTFPDGSGPVRDIAEAKEQSLSSSTITTAAGEKSLAGPLDQVPRGSRSLLYTAGAASLVLVAGLLYLLVGGEEGRSPEGSPLETDSPTATRPAALRPAARPAPPPHGATRAASPAPAPRQKVAGKRAPDRRLVFIALKITPGDAEVSLDGERRIDNPLVLAWSRTKHNVVIKAEGYKPRTIHFTAQKDLTFVVGLERGAPVRPAPAAAARKAAAPKPRPPERTERPVLTPSRARPGPKTAAPARRTKPDRQKKDLWLYEDL